jgi:hypothetical protein
MSYSVCSSRSAASCAARPAGPEGGAASRRGSTPPCGLSSAARPWRQAGMPAAGAEEAGHRAARQLRGCGAGSPGRCAVARVAAVRPRGGGRPWPRLARPCFSPPLALTPRAVRRQRREAHQPAQQRPQRQAARLRLASGSAGAAGTPVARTLLNTLPTAARTAARTPAPPPASTQTPPPSANTPAPRRTCRPSRLRLQTPR